MTIPIWVTINPHDDILWQTEYLPQCWVPIFGEGLDIGQETESIECKEYDLIVLTQGCDLENKKVDLVATCPIDKISEIRKYRPSDVTRDKLNNIASGRTYGLHMIPPLNANGTESDFENKDNWLIVDFREIYSLPYKYLLNKAKALPARYRLESPYLQNFSHAFGDYFSRVGLPTKAPKF